MTRAPENARVDVARACGVPLVMTLEAMGYWLVPTALVGSMAKLLAKAADATDQGPEARS